ncbi:hypothetical protein BDQ12DRAFT_611211, partial [Crucibulum laeve]
EFGSAQIESQEDLKQVFINSTALCSIDYNSPANVILALNTLPIAVGFLLY